MIKHSPWYYTVSFQKNLHDYRMSGFRDHWYLANKFCSELTREQATYNWVSKPRICVVDSCNFHYLSLCFINWYIKTKFNWELYTFEFEWILICYYVYSWNVNNLNILSTSRILASIILLFKDKTLNLVIPLQYLGAIQILHKDNKSTDF